MHNAIRPRVPQEWCPRRFAIHVGVVEISLVALPVVAIPEVVSNAIRFRCRSIRVFLRSWVGSAALVFLDGLPPRSIPPNIPFIQNHQRLAPKTSLHILLSLLCFPPLIHILVSSTRPYSILHHLTPLIPRLIHPPRNQLLRPLTHSIIPRMLPRIKHRHMRRRLITRLLIHRLLKTPAIPLRLRDRAERPLAPLHPIHRTYLDPPSSKRLRFSAVVRCAQRTAAEHGHHVCEADAFFFFQSDDALEAGFELFAADEAPHKFEVASYPCPAFRYRLSFQIGCCASRRDCPSCAGEHGVLAPSLPRGSSGCITGRHARRMQRIFRRFRAGRDGLGKSCRGSRRAFRGRGAPAEGAC